MGALAALIFVLETSAAPRSGVDSNIVRTLSTEEASIMWNEFSRSGIARDYCMEFTLSHRPRKGEESMAFGEIYGSKTPDGFDLTRLRIFERDSASNSPKCLADYILVNDPRNQQVYKSENGVFKPVAKNEWGKPLVAGFILSPFDLMMPYKFWQHSYDGAGRIGQAVHFFKLSPNSSEQAAAAVRLALSREFSSPVQAQILDANSRPLKTLSLSSVKKIDSLWIMREASLRDESSRDKDILKFISVNFKAANPKRIFDPNSQTVAPQKPTMQKI